MWRNREWNGWDRLTVFASHHRIVFFAVKSLMRIHVAAITLATLVSLLAGCAKKDAADPSVGHIGRSIEVAGNIEMPAARAGHTSLC
jgi:hypothetical protein